MPVATMEAPAARKAAQTGKRRAAARKAANTRRGKAATGPVTTRVSSKHQVTIPIEAFREAGLETGDALHAEALGSGKVVLTRVAQIADRYSGALDTGGALREKVEAPRGEWR